MAITDDIIVPVLISRGGGNIGAGGQGGVFSSLYGGGRTESLREREKGEERESERGENGGKIFTG